LVARHLECRQNRTASRGCARRSRAESRSSRAETGRCPDSPPRSGSEDPSALESVPGADDFLSQAESTRNGSPAPGSGAHRPQGPLHPMSWSGGDFSPLSAWCPGGLEIRGRHYGRAFANPAPSSRPRHPPRLGQAGWASDVAEVPGACRRAGSMLLTKHRQGRAIPDFPSLHPPAQGPGPPLTAGPEAAGHWSSNPP